LASNSSQHVSTGEKLGYGVGDLAFGLILNFFAFFLPFYFIDLLGVAPAAIGLMMLLTKLVDAFTDPMMGVIADRTRTRWGRYRPYLLYAPLPLAVTIVLVFSAPEDIGDTALLVWAYITYTLSMLTFTAVNIPYGGLLGVISPSSKVRASVTGFRMFFSALGGILVGALGTTLIRVLGAGDDRLGVLYTVSSIAAVTVFCLLITFFSTEERIPPAAENGAPLKDLGVLLRTGSWIALAIAAVMGVTAIASRAASALFFFDYVVKDDGAPVFLFFDRPALFLTGLAVGQVSGVILGGLLMHRIEKVHLLIAAGTLKMAMILTFYTLPLDAVWTQTTVQYAVGIGFGMLMVLSYSMFTDIAEFVDWKYRRQMTALVIAASVFGVKTGIAFGAAIPGLVLGLTGFVKDAEQTETAIMGIQLAFAIIPAFVMLPAVIALMFYRIDRKVIAKVESDLLQRREAQP
jgi:GPH family glycoside/pentoside/hexuronide:cation symporter